MTCSLKRMNQCECHGVAFDDIARYSRILGTDDLTVLTEKLGFGQTCTACHCDVKALLSEQSGKMANADSESFLVAKVGSRFS